MRSCVDQTLSPARGDVCLYYHVEFKNIRIEGSPKRTWCELTQAFFSAGPGIAAVLGGHDGIKSTDGCRRHVVPYDGLHEC